MKRSFSFVDSYFEVMDACRTSLGSGLVKQVVPMLWGDKGIGKTYLHKEYAQQRGLEYIPLHFGQFDTPGDLLGKPYDEEEVTRSGRKRVVTRQALPDWFPTGDVPTLIHCDEINRANSLVAQMLHPFLLDRRIGQHELPDNAFISACANPPDTEFFTNDLSVTIIDRLLHIVYPVDNLAKDWISWAVRSSIDHRIIDSVLETPALISAKAVMNPRETPTPRSLHMLSILIKDKELSIGALAIIAIGLLGPVMGKDFIERYRSEDNALAPLSPFEILNSYPKIRLTVKLMSSWRFRRADLLSITVKKLTELLKSDVVLNGLDNSQVVNLWDFASDLPEELGQSLVFLKKLPKRPVTLKGVPYGRQNQKTL